MQRLILAALLLSAAFLPAEAASASAPTLERFARRFTGAFSNIEQAAGTKHYQRVVLHVARIWPERNDGPWFYAEQALAEAVDQPYRQRLYRLTLEDDGVLALLAFDLPDPIAATGAWRQPQPLAELGRSVPTLAQRECTVYFAEMPDGSFVGATRGTGCPSDLRGATYATSELTVAGDHLDIWERGFAPSGRQVWGPTAGGHRFKRLAVP